MCKRKKDKIVGTSTKPRLAVFRSNRHIYVQAIDDHSCTTIASCSTLEKEVKDQCKSTATKLASKRVGETIATRLLEKNIREILFDRRKKPYHGRIKELAEGARLVGLIF